MNRSSIRGWVRRRLNDVGNDPQLYSDEEVNEAISLGCMEVQKSVIKTDPNAFNCIVTWDLQKGEQHYPKPTGLISIHIFQYRAATGSSYFPIDRESAPRILLEAANGWAILGNAVLVPAPAADVEKGCQIYYTSALVLDQDEANPETMGLVQPLHFMIVSWTCKLLTPELGESAAIFDGEIQKFESQIGDFYSQERGGRGLDFSIDYAKYPSYGGLS